MTTFATIDELAIRLGKTGAGDLTAAQAAQGAMLLELVTGMIVSVVGHDDTWATALDPVPVILRAVCLEAAARVMTNPSGARSQSETLGAYQHAESFTDNGHGLLLTDVEIALCRGALGSASGSVQIPSMYDPANLTAGWLWTAPLSWPLP